ncbi:CARDB domain-containing protein [Halotia wernerae UHCC 0503]|nr:CARDB domain-containing protein [Halotia wernerae UHCC 0503]
MKKLFSQLVNDFTDIEDSTVFRNSQRQTQKVGDNFGVQYVGCKTQLWIDDICDRTGSLTILHNPMTEDVNYTQNQWRQLIGTSTDTTKNSMNTQKQLPDLSISFGTIEEPTIFPDEQGKVSVIVTNQAQAKFKGPLTLNLYASTDSVLDNSPLNTLNPALEGTDELLGSLDIPYLKLAPGESKTFTLDFTDTKFRTPSVVSPGAYYLITEVEPNNTISETNKDNNLNSIFVSTPGTDIVLDWNSTLSNAIQTNNIKIENEFAKGNTEEALGLVALDQRNAAILHAAIYDAVNAIDRSHAPYLVNIDPSETVGASPEAAAVGAAYQTLINLYPGEVATFEAQKIRSLEEIPDSQAQEVGYDLGVRVANQILESRSNDGALEAFFKPYTAQPTPGVWRPTINSSTDEIGGDALLPGWGDVTPFVISSVEDILEGTGVDGPPALDSIQYAEELEQVRLFGGLEDTDVTQITRTPEQTEIANFWAYDRSSTFGEPYNIIAQDVALQQGNTLAENARLFALMNMAVADAGVVAFDVKYTYNQWRPITGIREANTNGNPYTIQDPNWKSLLDTPPHPDYMAAHSALGAAAGTVLASFYGTDNISFSIPSQELPGVARHFQGFRDFVEENSISRFYGGIHLPSSSEAGLIAGTSVGNYVFNNVLV